MSDALCPACAESIQPADVRCAHCGERLGPGLEPSARPLVTPLGCAIVALGGLMGLLVLAIAIPNLIEARKLSSGDSAPIGALKTIGTSQSLFREGDKDRDGVLDYGTLTELAQQDLVDSVLGAGTKQGYTFLAAPSPLTPEFLWFAIANPVQPGVTGDRYFLTTHEGVIYYRANRAFTAAELLPTCTIPPDARPVGK